MFLMKKVFLLVLCLACAAPGALAVEAEWKPDAYEAALQEELSWQAEMLEEMPGWSAGAEALDEEVYPWVGQARDMLIRHFDEAYGADISDRAAQVGVYVSESIPEYIEGFHDGSGNVCLNPDALRQDDRMLHICLHEMLHALGTDFFFDVGGLATNGLYEGLTEAATEMILVENGMPCEDISTYGEISQIVAGMMDADPELLRDVVLQDEFDISARVDARAGDGSGEALIAALALLAGGGEDAQIAQAAGDIASAYCRMAALERAS